MPGRSTATSIDAYIAGFPRETQKALEEVRALIKASAPDATERISYAIPTFDLNGRHLVHFAGYEKHIGFYPTRERTKGQGQVPEEEEGLIGRLAQPLSLFPAVPQPGAPCFHARSRGGCEVPPNRQVPLKW